jgi:hypothetical protein
MLLIVFIGGAKLIPVPARMAKSAAELRFGAICAEPIIGLAKSKIADNVLINVDFMVDFLVCDVWGFDAKFFELA